MGIRAHLSRVKLRDGKGYETFLYLLALANGSLKRDPEGYDTLTGAVKLDGLCFQSMKIA